MVRITSLALASALAVPAAADYPVEVTNCHLETKVDEAPSRVLVASSGALEIMLAMGLEDRIVASCWVKEVWAPLMPAFEKFPHFPKYPNHTEVMDLDPDFIYATYSSAFDLSRINYTEMLDVEDCELVIAANVYGDNKTYCRQELHDAGIGTYLSTGYCEKVEHRPEDVSVNDLFNEVEEIGEIFDARDKAREMVKEIEDDFDLAQAITSGGEGAEPLKVLWFDMYNSTSGTNPNLTDPEPYVGACCGGPQIIIDHAGAKNVFEDRGVEDRRIWDYVKLDDWAETDPDVIVLVVLSTEGAEKKLSILCQDERTRDMRAVRERNFIVVPFAATNLGVRLGALAYNMAEAMGALARGKPLNALQFTIDPDVGEATSTSGAAVWADRLPKYEEIDLEEVCPGTPKKIEVKDLSQMEEMTGALLLLEVEVTMEATGGTDDTLEADGGTEITLGADGGSKDTLHADGGSADNVEVDAGSLDTLEAGSGAAVGGPLGLAGAVGAVGLLAGL